jgi:MFS family permease
VLTFQSDSNVNTSEEEFPWRRAWAAAGFLALAGLPLGWASVAALFGRRWTAGLGMLGLLLSLLLLGLAWGLARARHWTWDAAVIVLSMALLPLVYAGILKWDAAGGGPGRVLAFLPLAYAVLAQICLLTCRRAWDRSTR